MNWQNKKKASKKPPANFIEALRDLSGSVASASKTEAAGLGQNILEHMGGQDTFRSQGELQPNQTIDFESLQKRERQLQFKENRIQEEIVSLKKQEKILYSHQQQEVKLQIKAIQEELKKLAQTTEGLAKEVKIASIQSPVAPGTYHLSFFTRLRSFVFEFRKKIQDSKTWLSAFNQRAKRKSYYWGQVGKSGTKFMLSQERYMATTAG